MHRHHYSDNFRIIVTIAVCVLLIVVALIYSNTLRASWHLDDYHTIPNNSAVQVPELNTETLKEAIHAHPVVIGRLYRPVSMLSFALNWYLGGGDLTGYHLVNIGIHLMNTLLLLLTVRALFKTPRLCSIDRQTADITALLAAAFWALNPVQVQAVTYIVQRMASLSALFYLLSLFLFIQARRLTSSKLRIALIYIGCLISFALSVGAKENGLTLPLALLLVEWTFFQISSGKTPSVKARVLRIAAGVGIGIGGLCFLMLSWGDIFTLSSNLYEHRAFTFSERVLTETRVIWFYLGLLFYPAPHRLSIEHDFPLSLSLGDPWTTPVAMAGLAIGILLAIARLRKNPLISFAFLFFILTHLLESSVFPLRIIFEHRNYLPSLFLFVPMSYGICRLTRSFIERKSAVAVGLIGLTGIVLIGLSAGTYVRNFAWHNELTLWEDARRKAPNSPIPFINMAVYHFEPLGRLDVCIGLNKQALDLSENRDPEITLISLKNIAGYYFQSGQYEDALTFYNRALAIDPRHQVLLWGRAQTLAALGRWEAASKDGNTLLGIDSRSETGLLVKGYFFANQRKFRQAEPYLIKALAYHPDSFGALIAMSTVCNSNGQYIRAEDYLQRAAAIRPEAPFLLPLTAENIFLKGDIQKAEVVLSKWIEAVGSDRAEKWFSGRGKGLSLPIPNKEVDVFIRNTIHAKNISE